ncbi:hypothetical protein PTTG_04937 [Puccinia triticina 1-1 BBBD Race 1]|uniref:DUF3455 domain-containing protein n=2 Tax=Puccinia triticina TaxID=208348 RepID=A0A0C4EVV1_PUCT1|nr:hypothetical protein PTTG_04937 [Puccinia triticina 1-1 BBBD Race 1]
MLAGVFGDQRIPYNVPGQQTSSGQAPLAFQGNGNQIYSCGSTGAWVRVGAEAQLQGSGMSGHHYFSGNTATFDVGSWHISATQIGSSASRDLRRDVPSLRLQPTSGPFRLITRSNVSGGVPQVACKAGQQNYQVPYSATYTFYYK